MLLAFTRFLRRFLSGPPAAAPVPRRQDTSVYTYSRGNVVFCVTAPGTQSIVELTEEQATEMLTEIDIEMMVGNKIPEITTAQFMQTAVFREVYPVSTSINGPSDPDPSAPSFSPSSLGYRPAKK